MNDTTSEPLKARDQLYTHWGPFFVDDELNTLRSRLARCKSRRESLEVMATWISDCTRKRLAEDKIEASVINYIEYAPSLSVEMSARVGEVVPAASEQVRKILEPREITTDETAERVAYRWELALAGRVAQDVLRCQDVAEGFFCGFTLGKFWGRGFSKEKRADHDILRSQFAGARKKGLKSDEPLTVKDLISRLLRNRKKRNDGILRILFEEYLKLKASRDAQAYDKLLKNHVYIAINDKEAPLAVDVLEMKDDGVTFLVGDEPKRKAITYKNSSLSAWISSL